MSSYDLSRAFFDWSFENPEKVKTIHIAIYFFAIEHNNRLGWKEKFGFPSGMAMEAIGVKNYSTYISALKELVEFGFIEMVEKSKNQYSANIIMLNSAIPKNSKANSKALDKAFIKHGIKQSKSTGESNSESTVQSTMQSNDTIDKQINNITIEQTNKETNELISTEISDSENLEVVSKNQKKEKKESCAKEKKESPHNGMVSVWFEWFEKEFGVEPKMTDRDGLVLKRIREYLTKLLNQKNNYSNENLFESFKIILEAIKEHEWIYQNVSLSIIESKINELIAIVRKPKQTKTQIQEASTMSALEILNRKTLNQ
jgi:hypothetical protein